MWQGVTGVGVKVESVVSVEVWDFAGQELYYASHPVFLTSRAIYILVCNLSKSLAFSCNVFCRVSRLV